MYIHLYLTEEPARRATPRRSGLKYVYTNRMFALIPESPSSSSVWRRRVWSGAYLMVGIPRAIIAQLSIHHRHCFIGQYLYGSKIDVLTRLLRSPFVRNRRCSSPNVKISFYSPDFFLPLFYTGISFRYLINYFRNLNIVDNNPFNRFAGLVKIF